MAWLGGEDDASQGEAVERGPPDDGGTGSLEPAARKVQADGEGGAAAQAADEHSAGRDVAATANRVPRGAWTGVAGGFS